MKKLFLLPLLLLVSYIVSAQTLKNYEFKIIIHGVADTTLMLGHHYGGAQYVIDTVPVNSNGEAIFKSNDTLPGGIYLVVAPSLKNKYFEMIVSGFESTFTLETDTLDFVKHMKVTGSPENKLFYEDLNYISTKKEAMNALKVKMDAAGETTEAGKAIKEEMKVLNTEVETYRQEMIKTHPELFYSKFLKAVIDIKIPEAPINPDGTKDSTFALKYVKQHYFDNVDFNDERLLRTNMYDTKIKKYIKDYVTKLPDSLMVAVDYIIGKASVNNKTFQYVTVMLLNEYATSKIMGFDAVYVHIVDKFYSGGKAFWLDDVGLYRIQAQADKVRPTLLGKKGQPLVLQDTAGHDIPLYSIDKRFTVVIFWSPDCGHCKKEMPKVEALYPELKALGAEVYAVYSEEEFDKWEKWLKEHNYPWVNVANINGKEMYNVKYNVDVTPLIFLLDKNKVIFGKKINIDQVSAIIKDRIKYEEQLGH
jgi:thiol-disulfide isomerase/thioredoxin